MDIDGAMSMAYTPVEADDGYYLRVKVTYTDAHGSQMEMATTDMAVTSNRPPAFAEDATTREVAEDTADWHEHSVLRSRPWTPETR